MDDRTTPVVRALSRRPARAGFTAGEQARLGDALAEAGTILLLVLGGGPESDTVEARCRALAGDPGFEAVRVLRLPDAGALTREQRDRWLPRGGRLAVLGADRGRAVTLARPDAVELFVAVATVAA